MVRKRKTYVLQDTAPETKVTTRGRITLPKAIRKQLMWRPEARVEFTIRPDGQAVFIRPKAMKAAPE